MFKTNFINIIYSQFKVFPKNIQFKFPKTINKLLVKLLKLFC